MAWRAKKDAPKRASPAPKGAPRRASRGNTNVTTPVKAGNASDQSAGTPTVKVIAKIEKDRENRRKAMAAAVKERKEENALNEKMGRPGDVDFQRMIKAFRSENHKFAQPHCEKSSTKINICVRKRPVNKKEIKKKDHDSVTCMNPIAIVHECKLRVDGITKYLDNNEFTFDHSFNETSTNDEVYNHTAKKLVHFVFSDKGRATVFAYGQTGSGKTHTMEGIQHLAAKDIFQELKNANDSGKNLSVYISFFEIYGGRCQDLLHKRKRLSVRQDGSGEVQIVGLEENRVNSMEEMKQMIEKGNSIRTTHATEVNDQSSRSHGICQISIRNSAGQLHGKLSLIDLAGSERGADTKSHNRQRRMESANINTSLLALKECIRALDSKSRLHVPFRASKLTLVLKDSFSNVNARTVMIATVSPCSSSTDHTVNTLRYADRVKENKGGLNAMQKNYQPSLPPSPPKAIVGREAASPSLMPPPPPANAKVQKKPAAAAAPCAPLVSSDDDDDVLADSLSSQDDLKRLQDSLRKQSKDRLTTTEDEQNWESHETAVHMLYEEEEDLLTAHMNSIQENADLLTEEGGLLASIQGDDVVDYDIDAYSARLEEILERKAAITSDLRKRLSTFRRRLQEEETKSKKASKLPNY